MTEFDKIKQYRNEHNEFARFLGIETTLIREGYAEAEVKMKDHYYNPVGSAHGGCLFTLADVVAGAAAASYGNAQTTLDVSFHYLRPALGAKRLYGVAEVIKKGKNVSVFCAELKDEDGNLLAQGTFTFFDLKRPLLDFIKKD